MINTKFFTDIDMNKLERKVTFYFRNHKERSLLNVDICSAFDPRDNEMHYTAAVMYEVVSDNE